MLDSAKQDLLQEHLETVATIFKLYALHLWLSNYLLENLENLEEGVTYNLFLMKTITQSQPYLEGLKGLIFVSGSK